MKPNAPKPQRCAIYTRKSTEHNLDLAFNSLDAQREACEAYIKSQAHEGWTLVPERFDDGGLSGASLDRPALQALLDQVRSRMIGIIVVYKVDRLTRSLADFAKLVELFDAHEVSFVSVTQSFNTTSSMGRLTLNVLLSFAQFEREVIGERVRDKIAASKSKGLWVGGPVPLGYRSMAKKLEVVPEDAALVRKIFADYLRLGSIGELAASLDRDGIRPRPRKLANGRIIAAERFMVGPLAHILKNRFYIGEIVYRGEVHKGEHAPILDRDLYEAVQAKLAERAVQRKFTRSRSPSILAGLIFDDRGNPMSPSHANKKGVRYRYYVSQALLQSRKTEAGSIARVSAPDVEALVCRAVKEAGQTDPETAQTGNDIPDHELIVQRVERVMVRPDRIAVTLCCTETGADQSDAETETNSSTNLVIPFAPKIFPRKGIAHAPAERGTIDPRTQDTLLQAIARSRSCTETGAHQSDAEAGTSSSMNLMIPFTPKLLPRKGIAHAPAERGTIDPRTQDTLLQAIARSRSWMDAVLAGKTASFNEIASAEGLAERHIRRLVPLAFLSPKIIQAIADGTGPAGLTVSSLTQALPHAWTAQEQMLGLS